MMSTAAPARTIGLFGATVTIIGFVVGASIFILPGAIAAEAGPGVVLSYLVAGLLALFSCVVAAQIGVAFPTSGASFVAIGRLVSPLAGFVCIWMMIGAAAVAVALLGYGFADYVHVWIAGVDRRIVGLVTILLLTLINLFGVREAVSAQYIMVAAFAAALVLFGVAALLNADASNFVPFLPNGIEPALAGAVPAFFSFAGFMIIIELGGEVKNPGHAIPIALGASFLVVLALYSLTSIAVVGLIPWEELKGLDAPVAVAAARVLPAPLAGFVSFAVLAATISSINVMLMAYSRDVYVLARGGVFPNLMAKTIGRNSVPIGGILTIAAVSLVAYAFEAKITEYATFVVIGVLCLQIGLGVAAMLLPGKPQYAELRDTFRLSAASLRFFAAGLVLLSAAFLFMIVRSAPATAALALGYLALGVVYYLVRRTMLAKTSAPLEQPLIKALDDGSN